MNTYQVHWPRSARQVDPLAPAPRPPTLDGKTVAFLWDYMFRGEEIFPIIEEELRLAFPEVTIVPYTEFGTTHGEGEAALVAGLGRRLDELGVDAVVSGMGC